MHFIHLQSVIDSDFPAVIRLSAARLQTTPYLDVGTYLKNLSTPDLKELCGYCSAVALKEDSDVMFDSLVMLGEMLAQAEGTPLDSVDVQRTSNLMILLSFENLARKGLIDFKRESATLSGDVTDIDNLVKLR